MKEINLCFDGTWLSSTDDANNLPNEGSYAYVLWNITANNCYDKILYIGQSISLKDRTLAHISDDEWLEKGFKLYLSFAKVQNEDLDITENAFIYKFKPIWNGNLKDNFMHYSTEFNVDGNIDKNKIPHNFEIER